MVDSKPMVGWHPWLLPAPLPLSLPSKGAVPQRICIFQYQQRDRLAPVDMEDPSCPISVVTNTTSHLHFLLLAV